MNTVDKTVLTRQSCYDLLRIFLVFLVVIGHSTYLDINTHFGGIHYASLMQTNEVSFPIFYKLANFLNVFIYTFHMPVFIALSGSILL